MTRPLRVGDRVTATGTVRTDRGKVADVMFDGHDFPYLMVTAHLTVIAPAEPPVGSVVVKDGVAWIRVYVVGLLRWYSPVLSRRVPWSDVCDGDAIFTPGEDA